MATNTLRFHRLSRSDFNSNPTRTYNKGDLYFIYESNGTEGVIYMCKTSGLKSAAAFEQYSVVSFQSLTMSGAGKSVTYNPEDGSAKSIELTAGSNVSITDNGSTANALKLKISSSDALIEISWTDLKSKRDNGELTPGMQYRITDYVTTTAQVDTQSAGHPFDVIVTADSNNTLNENARAIQHEGDTYFTDCDLNAWKLWYCLDNDINRFTWADNTNGKGVIYRMIDEWNNDCPYDFKNIQFARDWSVVAPDSGLAGTIYCYTFSVFLDGFIDGATASDESVKAKECIESDGDGFFGDNTIGTYQNLGVCSLNNIVFVTDWTSFSVNHYSNTFGNICYNNTFGNDCYNNTFGNDCWNNTFGNDCYRNTFGNDCYNNTFGNNFQYSTFGNDCWNNTFGNDCYRNTFGNGCYRNTFGNNFQYSTFGNGCYSNTFGNICYSNTFGNGCQNINIQKDYVQYIIVESGNRYINITSTQTTSLSKPLRNFTIAQGVNNTTTIKTISHNTTNDKFKTTYQPVNSVVVSI